MDDPDVTDVLCEDAESPVTAIQSEVHARIVRDLPVIDPVQAVSTPPSSPVSKSSPRRVHFAPIVISVALTTAMMTTAALQLSGVSVGVAQHGSRLAEAEIAAPPYTVAWSLPAVDKPRCRPRDGRPCVLDRLDLHSAAETGAVLNGTGSVQPVLSSSSSSFSSEVRVPSPVMGVYLTEGSVRNDAFLTKIFDRLSAFPHPALVFNVKGSFVYFSTDAALATSFDLVRPMYDLPRIIQMARDRGIYTIGRYIAVKDAVLSSQHPETQIRTPKTNRSVGDVWVEPSNETVLEYNRQILSALAASGIDEINLDYIRYPTEYSPASIGLSGIEKGEKIYQFIAMARDAIKSVRPETKLGISTYAILGWNFPVNYEAVGQDIPRLGEVVDIISPMAYPATFSPNAYYNPAKNPGSRMYYLVYRTLTGYQKLLGENAWKLRPWIQGYGITSQNFRDEVQAVFDAGLCGFQVWNAGNNYTIALDAMTVAKRPASCQGE